MTTQTNKMSVYDQSMIYMSFFEHHWNVSVFDNLNHEIPEDTIQNTDIFIYNNSNDN